MISRAAASHEEETAARGQSDVPQHSVPLLLLQNPKKRTSLSHKLSWTGFVLLLLHPPFQQPSLLLCDAPKPFGLTGGLHEGNWRMNQKVLQPGALQDACVSPSPVGPLFNFKPPITAEEPVQDGTCSAEEQQVHHSPPALPAGFSLLTPSLPAFNRRPSSCVQTPPKCLWTDSPQLNIFLSATREKI